MFEIDALDFDLTPAEFCWRDSRNAARHDAHLDATFRLESQNGPQHPARIRDISSTGLALVVTRPISAETTVAVEIPNAPALFPQPLHVCVRHVTERPGGYWVAGCQLLDTLSADDLRLLLG